MTEARALAVWAEPRAVELLDLLRTALNLMGWPLLAAPGCPSEDASAVAPLPYRP
jgi:hypothetical protein